MKAFKMLFVYKLIVINIEKKYKNVSSISIEDKNKKYSSLFLN